MLARFEKVYRIKYWRNKRGNEVDLILEPKTGITDQGKIAIEIKATQRPVADDFLGLDAFSEEYACQATLLVCQIEQTQCFGRHRALPWQNLVSEIEALRITASPPFLGK